MSPTRSVPASGFSWPTIIRNERRLPGAVGADDADDAAARQLERQALDQDAVAERLLHVVGLDDDVAESRPGRDRDLERRRALLERLVEHRVVGLQARLALGLAGARRHPDPLELAGERALARGLGFLLLREPLPLLLEPGRVVALPRDAVAAVELEDPARDVVEEVAVVGDRDDRPRILLQEALEPGDRLGVEMVGRLVEQQHVRAREQQPAEGDAAPLAARDLRHVRVAGRAAERVHRDLDRAIEVPGVRGVDLVLEPRLLVEQLLHLVGFERLAELAR